MKQARGDFLCAHVITGTWSRTLAVSPGPSKSSISHFKVILRKEIVFKKRRNFVFFPLP